MADEWKNNEANTLNTVSQKYRQIATALSQSRDQLSNISTNITNNIVSGPPADYLNQKWDECRKSLNVAIEKLNNAAGNMDTTGRNWQNDYKKQKDDERKKEEESKKKTPNGGGGGSW